MIEAVPLRMKNALLVVDRAEGPSMVAMGVGTEARRSDTMVAELEMPKKDLTMSYTEYVAPEVR